MCLILFQLHEHPTYKLVLAANRDESYERPTLPAHYWEDQPNVLAGRDLVQMGTWLGISRNGRIAALTNYRDPAHMNPGKTSRGHIVSNYLTGDESSHDYVNKLRHKKDDFVGFNVLVGDGDHLAYYNNIEDQITSLSPGVHGLSNHFLNTPWPKVENGKKRLHHYLKQTEVVQTNDLFQILANAEEAEESMLPNTGIGLELEKKLSPMFINIPGYGTRCSTVLTIDYDNRVSFSERTFQAGEFIDEVHVQFQINS
ncbi:NRDE family protein [Ornithinibacillus massiliensis]|uniref:NRDE family protein n=1 Tax=Ornithinibacillus massiliensis TaxID=1944633 RepID=A0ABS5MEV5_9BACI|nr:NRDE family protein [Ornithinibacillus massiliensis]MBS3680647.1 NRDE family protein [Ornithinibacillus massiliensis]